MSQDLIHGMNRLLKIRQGGHKPAGVVWLWIGFEPSNLGVSATDLEMRAPSLLADLRPLVGLSVCLCANTHSVALMALWERLKLFAASQVLWVKDLSEDAGSMLTFDRKHGQRTIGECCNA